MAERDQIGRENKLIKEKWSDGERKKKRKRK